MKEMIMNMMYIPNMNENIVHINSIHNMNFIKHCITKMIIFVWNKTLEELINGYLKRIWRNDLIKNKEKVFRFIYNAEKINEIDKKGKKSTNF